MTQDTLLWFDAHVDLALIAQEGRNMLAEPAIAGGGGLPGCITFPSLRRGRVRWVLGTLFTQRFAPTLSWGYGDIDDASMAHQAAMGQLRLYHAWEEQGYIRLVKRKSDLNPHPDTDEPLQVILLMENADPILDEQDAQWWFDQGLRVVGLSWTHGSRYAAGNGVASIKNGRPCGLSEEGKAMVQTLSRLGVVHDLSHFNDQAAREVLSLATSRVIASHSASRTMQASSPITVDEVATAVVAQRHINDEQLDGLAKRRGIVGLPMYSRFLSDKPQTRPTLERVVEHLNYLATRLGGTQYVGLGSDYDGGFSANDTPLGLEGPDKLHHLAQALAKVGWSQEDIAGFASGNWLRFFKQVLPE